jgi:hypothetical protein
MIGFDLAMTVISGIRYIYMNQRLETQARIVIFPAAFLGTVPHQETDPRRWPQVFTYLHHSLKDGPTPSGMTFSFWFHPSSFPEDDKAGTILFQGGHGKGKKVIIGLGRNLKVRPPC